MYSPQTAHIQKGGRRYDVYMTSLIPITFNGNYEKLLPEEHAQFRKWFDSYRDGLDTYIIYHFDINTIPTRLLKIIIAYAIEYNQNIELNFVDNVLTSLKIEICSNCLASAYAEYLGYKLEVTT